jgi:hypothetical protein
MFVAKRERVDASSARPEATRRGRAPPRGIVRDFDRLVIPGGQA